MLTRMNTENTVNEGMLDECRNLALQQYNYLNLNYQLKDILKEICSKDDVY